VQKSLERAMTIPGPKEGSVFDRDVDAEILPGQRHLAFTACCSNRILPRLHDILQRSKKFPTVTAVILFTRLAFAVTSLLFPIMNEF